MQHTPKELRLARIESAQAEAARLLDLVADESLKDILDLAKGDLDDANAWLNQKNVDTNPSAFMVVDSLLHFAERRLRVVKDDLGRRLLTTG